LQVEKEDDLKVEMSPSRPRRTTSASAARNQKDEESEPASYGWDTCADMSQLSSGHQSPATQMAGVTRQSTAGAGAGSRDRHVLEKVRIRGRKMGAEEGEA
jgi:hypothetical protein